MQWSLAPRFAEVWDSFDVQTRYDHDLVDPDHWTAHLDACASTNASSYEFTAPGAISVSPSGCRADVRFPAEGSYPVSVTVAGPTGTETAGVDVVIDDLFIVSLGDSAASGEGNPDNLHGIGGDEWQDPRCHRSAKSGMARAAAALETPHRSVTFVSFACSGAEIDHILDTQYGGIQPNGGPKIEPQLEDLDNLLCDGPALNCESDPRPVDAIWISVGINDVNFSTILEECAKPWIFDNCNADSTIRALAFNGMTQMRNRAVELDDALSSRDGALAGTLEQADVYLTEYPDDLFDSEAACGAFNIDLADLLWPDFGIIDVTEGVNEPESEWLHETGVALNALVFELTVRHGWQYVDGISEDFAGNGYCSSDPWFRHLSESFFTQGDYKGVVHPNVKGHENIQAHVLEAFAAPLPPRPPARNVTLVIEAVKVTDQRDRCGGGRRRRERTPPDLQQRPDQLQAGRGDVVGVRQQPDERRDDRAARRMGGALTPTGAATDDRQPPDAPGVDVHRFAERGGALRLHPAGRRLQQPARRAAWTPSRSSALRTAARPATSS